MLARGLAILTAKQLHTNTCCAICYHFNLLSHMIKNLNPDGLKTDKPHHIKATWPAPFIVSIISLDTISRGSRPQHTLQLLFVSGLDMWHICLCR